jgi:hypothetical protein
MQVCASEIHRLNDGGFLSLLAYGVNAVRETGTATEGIPPVNVPATPEWADQIQMRIQLFNELARPCFE